MNCFFKVLIILLLKWIFLVLSLSNRGLRFFFRRFFFLVMKSSVRVFVIFILRDFVMIFGIFLLRISKFVFSFLVSIIDRKSVV